MLKKVSLLPAIAIIALYLSAGSCANTSTPPMGGPKDTLAPVLVKVAPDSCATNVPVKDVRIELRFNEFVQLKDAEKQIYISPSLSKRIQPKIRAKSVVIELEDTLKPNTTYTVDFGASISDNNEGNPFPPYSLAFSTGSTVDSLMASGFLYDYKSLLPIEGVTVGFYSDLSDSSIYKTYPAKIAKTDKWGYFVVKNLKKIPYRVFAFLDINANSKFDIENEKSAFIDNFITPSKAMRKDSPELAYTDIKDTAACLARPKELDLYLFKTPSTRQYIKNSGRKERKMMFISFSAPYPKIDSIGFEGLQMSKIIKQFNPTRDSLVMWINDTTYKAPDTLYLNVKYHKTDSLNRLTPFKERVELIAPRVKKAQEKPKRNNFGQKENKKPENLINLKIEAAADNIEHQGFVLNFPAPLIKSAIDSISINFISPKGQKGVEKFEFSRDTALVCTYYIKPKNKIRQGFEYRLNIPAKTFVDIYGFVNDTTLKSVMLPNDEKLGKISLNMTDVDGNYIVELTTLSRDRVLKTINVSKDGIIEFPYIAPGKYSVRITSDANRNGFLDTGNLSEKRQPEKVRLYRMSNGSSVIIIEESMEIVQEVNIKNIFAD